MIKKKDNGAHLTNVVFKYNYECIKLVIKKIYKKNTLRYFFFVAPDQKGFFFFSTVDGSSLYA